MKCTSLPLPLECILIDSRADQGSSWSECLFLANIVAKVAAAPLWNSNLNPTIWKVRTFISVLRVRVKTWINVTRSDGQILLQQYRHDADRLFSRVGTTFVNSSAHAEQWR